MYCVIVFTNALGKFGNPVGIEIDEKHVISEDERQKIAASSGFSETIFIDDVKENRISVFNPTSEIEFTTGHPLIGCCQFLSRLKNMEITSLSCKSGIVQCRHVAPDIYWVKASCDTLPPWNIEKLPSSEAVELVKASDYSNKEHTLIWAWEDEHTGHIRARTFAPDWGIPEDEANGSGSMLLAHQLKRELIITHGQGSIIYAKPVGDIEVEVGGRVR